MLLKERKQQKISGLFFEEFRRAVSPFRFLLLLIVSAAILTFGFRGLAQRVPFERSFLDNWFGTFADSYYFQLIPLIAAFPFADSFVIDKKQGFLFQVLSRATYGSYARIKTVVNALTGGIAAVFPLMILYFLTSVFTKAPLNHPEIDAASLRPTSPFLYDLYSTQPDLFILLLLMVVFIFGASLATLGLSVSCAINNRFVALGAPLFLYNGLEFFATRTRLIPNLFIPSRALFLPMNENQSIHSAAGCPTVFVLPGLFLLISFTIFAIFGKRSNAMNDDRKPFAFSPLLPADGGISWIPRGHLLRRMIIRAKCTFRMNIVLIVALAIAGSGLFYTRYLATNGNLFGEMGVIPSNATAWDVMYAAVGNQLVMGLIIANGFLFLISSIQPETGFGQLYVFRCRSRRQVWATDVLFLLMSAIGYALSVVLLLLLVATLVGYPLTFGWGEDFFQRVTEANLSVWMIDRFSFGTILLLWLLMAVAGFTAMGLAVYTINVWVNSRLAGYLMTALALMASLGLAHGLTHAPRWMQSLPMIQNLVFNQVPYMVRPYGTLHHPYIYWIVMIAVLTPVSLRASSCQDYPVKTDEE